MARAPEVHAAVYEIIASLGGSIAAEHGIGRYKRELLATIKSEVELDMMRQHQARLRPEQHPQSGPRALRAPRTSRRGKAPAYIAGTLLLRRRGICGRGCLPLRRLLPLFAMSRGHRLGVQGLRRHRAREVRGHEGQADADEAGGREHITTRDARNAARFFSPWCGRASSCMSRSAHWWTRRASARRIIFSSAPRRRGMRSPTAFRNMKVTRPRLDSDQPHLARLGFRLRSGCAGPATGSSRLGSSLSAEFTRAETGVQVRSPEGAGFSSAAASSGWVRGESHVSKSLASMTTGMR